MKALTVQQPWAWAIIHGGKDIENRTQAWSYRGLLAIHAGARLSERGCDAVPSIIDEEARPGVMRAYAAAELTYGAIIGTVELVDVHEAQPETHAYGSTYSAACCQSPWAEQEYIEHGGRTRRQLVHLVLENPVALSQPVPVPGRLGLWNLPTDVMRDVVARRRIAA